MREVDIIRAWKDSDYRENLSEEERALLPVNPVGELETELSDDELAELTGAAGGIPTIKGVWCVVSSVVSAVSALACPTADNGICSAALCKDTAYGCPESSLPGSGCPQPTFGTTKVCPQPIPVPGPVKPVGGN